MFAPIFLPCERQGTRGISNKSRYPAVVDVHISVAMPGLLALPYHESNRNEYLAQYFLSALGASSPVPRQEDIGVDFNCVLGKRDGKRLTFHSPYIVQSGSAAGKDFEYGGFNDGRWHRESIEWLFSQELPFFICTVDLKNLRFRMYSTSPMWLTRWRYGVPTSLEFCPDEIHDPLAGACIQRPGLPGGNGCHYRVPLRSPIIDLYPADLNTNVRDQAVAAMKVAVALEQENLTFRRLGLPMSRWFLV